MKLYALLLAGFLASATASAQFKQYVTGTPDTSFSVAKDYRNNLKKYPFIRIAPDSITTTVKEARNLVYCRVDTMQLRIDAFWPANTPKKSTPAILIVHGGGWRSGNHTQHIPLAQRLAALGYASFTVQYRLSTHAQYPAAVNDIKSAIQWMRINAKNYNIDPKKFVVLGFSAGGQLAALTGLTSNSTMFDKNDCNKGPSSAVQAVIDLDGTLSFVHPESSEFKNPDQQGASAWWIGDTPKNRPDLWKEASPLTYAEQNTLPFLFLNSAVERMHAGRDDFKKLMDKKGVYVDIKEFPNTPHTFCFYYPWFTPMVADIDAFMKKVFK